MSADSSPAKPARLLSLDALRGFDMLWIIGADTLVHQLARWLQTPWLMAFAQQLDHVAWDGLRAYDLIFPLFMFLSGIAIPLSFDGRLARGDSKRRMAGKIAARVAMLILLGMLYNGLLAAQPVAPRLASVLGQIGIAWGATAALYLVTQNAKKRIAILADLLGAIAALQLLVPVPGHGAGVLTEAGAINAWLDRLLLPGTLYGKTFDPEGLLCIASATTLTLAGSLLGSVLRKHAPSWRVAGRQAAAGGLCIAAGMLCWHFGYPPIKALWTTTFDLLAIGISLLVFALFFAVIDVLRWQRWSLALRVIGMNSLTIYLLTCFISFERPAGMIFGRLAHHSGEAGQVVLACGVLLIEWALLYFLYRKQWFLKV